MTDYQPGLFRDPDEVARERQRARVTRSRLHRAARRVRRRLGISAEQNQLLRAATDPKPTPDQPEQEERR